MRIEFHGLVFETPQVSVYLWTPWRASALEHKLFDAVRLATHTTPEDLPDEKRLDLAEPKLWKTALQAVVRVLKGWQEEAADAGREKRGYRWLVEGDADAHGYDSFGEAASLWMFLRVGIDRGNPSEPEKPEDVDLEGFGLRVWGQKE